MVENWLPFISLIRIMTVPLPGALYRNEKLPVTGLGKIANPSRYKLLKMSEILFSAKTQKEVFLSVMADWDEEIFEALKKDKDVNLLMINARNTYAFLAAMWQKSLIGNLIEFVVKIAKQ